MVLTDYIDTSSTMDADDYKRLIYYSDDIDIYEYTDNDCVIVGQICKCLNESIRYLHKNPDIKKVLLDNLDFILSKGQLTYNKDMTIDESNLYK
jgi:hypothetical protein